MPNLHCIAMLMCTEELESFKQPWSTDDCYEVILIIHDQLEFLALAIPMEKFFADRYRRELDVTKRLMAWFLDKDKDMPAKVVREYRERLRPLKERLSQ
jgi:hypothetical protein